MEKKKADWKIVGKTYWENNMNKNDRSLLKKYIYISAHLNFISFDGFKRVVPVSCNAFINWQEEEIQAIIVPPVQFW